MKDTYKTLAAPSEEVLFKDRNSKFFGYAFPVTSEEEAKEYIEELKKKHHQARHWCYAWQTGTEEIYYRVNDDGEPSNSAGMPIYGQIQSYELTNTLVVVVRYFGGAKLGVSGLINAYRTAARDALAISRIVERTINEEFVLIFDYPQMSIVMRLIKEYNLNIIDQDLGLDCKIIVSVRKSEAKAVCDKFENLHKVVIKKADH